MNRCEFVIEAIVINMGRRGILGALVLGIGGAILLSACIAGGESDDASKPSFTGRTPEPVGRIPIPPAPASDVATECAAEVEEPCMRYLIPLDGNPTSDTALRTKYVAAFGSACYMSDEDPSTFNCFYKSIKKACADAKLIGEVSGNAAYAKTYNCQAIGNGDYWLQIGPDVANKLFIYLQDAPRQTPLVDINGVPTAVNGPYRNLPEPEVVGPGERFYNDIIDQNGNKIEQRKYILQVNRNAHLGDAGIGEIHSDLAGFVYPCDKMDPSKMCTEPTLLKEGNSNDLDAPEVHHVVRRKDERCCPWGTNSRANAVVISRRLNSYLRNKYPDANEIIWINNLPSYTP